VHGLQQRRLAGSKVLLVIMASRDVHEDLQQPWFASGVST
jgi:hypothetical protein